MLTEEEKPTTSEEDIVLFDDLYVTYSTFKNGFTFTRGGNSYQWIAKHEFIPPSENRCIKWPYDEDVKWDLCQHASLAIQGRAEYVFETPNGFTSYEWKKGWHNVENGGGYLPSGLFSRVFYDDFTLCCILQRSARQLAPAYLYSVFEDSITLDVDAAFIHYATGPRQKETDFDIPAGSTINIGSLNFAIVGYRI
jgi:hypothetical protein